MTAPTDWTAPAPTDNPQRSRQDRERQEMELQARSPMRGRKSSAGLAGLPMFDPGLGL